MARDALGSRLLSAGRSQPRRRPLVVATSALLLLGLGMAAGRLTGGGGSSPDPPPSSPPALTETPPSAPRPTTARARTPEGAAIAAAAALTSLADARLVASPRARRSAIASVSTPEYRSQLEPLYARTYGYLSGLLGDSGRPGDLILRMTPLGYRIEAFSGRHASIAVWQVTLLATPERAPIAAWSTSRADLVWSAGRWRVSRFGADVPGPVPSVSAPAGDSAPGAFVAAAATFSPFTP